MPRILAIDDDAAFLRALKNFFQQLNIELDPVTHPNDALCRLQEESYDCVLLDVRIPGVEGLSLLRTILRQVPTVPVVMVSGQSTIQTVVEALREGAYDFVEKPLEPERFRIAVEHALEKSRWEKERLGLIRQLGESFPIVGQSEALKHVLQQIDRVAPTRATVLVTGETGTGKELVARAIHLHSRRASAPFVKVNCAAIPAELLESELFGHRKGAFTGATHDHRGKFLTAHGGTLFLDEIGELPLVSQAKLLQVLQDGTVDVVGESLPRQVDVRIVAATNRELGKMVQERSFRADLYHRLRVVEIQVPPLRERREDIALLARHFLKQFAQAYNRQLIDFAPQAYLAMERYDWPGNVRELRNVVEHIAIFACGPVVSAIEVENALDTHGSDQPSPRFRSLKEELAYQERKAILRALKATHYRIKEAAELLKIDRTSLFKKMKRYGIRRPEVGKD